jgi:hypothetical protein
LRFHFPYKAQIGRFNDAPCMQPYCPDTLDLFRVTKGGLTKHLQNKSRIIECGASVPAGSGAALFVQALATTTNLGDRHIGHMFG